MKLEFISDQIRQLLHRRTQLKWLESGRMRRKSSRAGLIQWQQQFQHPFPPSSSAASPLLHSMRELQAVQEAQQQEVTPNDENNNSGSENTLTLPPMYEDHLYGTDRDPIMDEEDDDEEEEDIETQLLRSLTLAGQDFVYSSDFDKNGIVYYLGTVGHNPDAADTSASSTSSLSWVNPATLSPPLIKVTSSGRHTTYSEVLHLSRTPVVALTSASQGSWICFDFMQRAILPTYYTLRHYTQASYALRNWVLEGSRDGEEWLLLRAHVNDTALAARDATSSWKIDLGQLHDKKRDETGLMEPFRKLRIRMTGPNSSNSWHLVCSGFEVYGKMLDYGALQSSRASTGFGGASSDLTAPPNPLWFHKLMLSQQYMIAFQTPRSEANSSSSASAANVNGFDMFRIPVEYARAIWSDFQSSTYAYFEQKGTNLAVTRPTRQSSVAPLSTHLLSAQRASVTYGHTPYGYAAPQHAVDGFIQDSIFTQAMTSTEETPWLEVDLGNSVAIGEVVVFGRRRKSAATAAPARSASETPPQQDDPNDDLPPPSSTVDTAVGGRQPLLLRQSSIIHTPAAVAPSVQAPSLSSAEYVVFISDAPLPSRTAGMTNSSFFELVASSASYLLPLEAITSPAHALESIAGTMHARMSPSMNVRGRFVRIMLNGEGELRVNQLCVFAPLPIVHQPLSSALSATAPSRTPSGMAPLSSAAPTTSLSSSTLTVATDVPPPTQSPAPSPSMANTVPAVSSGNMFTNNNVLSNVGGIQTVLDPNRVTGQTIVTTPQNLTAANVLAPNVNMTMNMRMNRIPTAISMAQSTPANTSSVSSTTTVMPSTSSSISSNNYTSDPLTLVPFYISVSLITSPVALELLTYLHRLCEKRNINVMELNILAEPESGASSVQDSTTVNNGVTLPFTSTELLQYPELARLGSEIFENIPVIKLYLLLIQHFNKVIMSLLPLIDFSVHSHPPHSPSSSARSNTFHTVQPGSTLRLADSIRGIRQFLLWSSKRNVWEQSLAATVASLPKSVEETRNSDEEEADVESKGIIMRACIVAIISLSCCTFTSFPPPSLLSGRTSTSIFLLRVKLLGPRSPTFTLVAPSSASCTNSAASCRRSTFDSYDRRVRSQSTMSACARPMPVDRIAMDCVSRTAHSSHYRTVHRYRSKMSRWVKR